MLTIKTYTNNPWNMNKEVFQDLLKKSGNYLEKKAPIKINSKSMNMGMLRPDKIQDERLKAKEYTTRHDGSSMLHQGLFGFCLTIHTGGLAAKLPTAPGDTGAERSMENPFLSPTFLELSWEPEKFNFLAFLF